MLSELFQDVRYGLRGLRRNPGFTTVALLTLALAVGANSAIFSFVDGVLLRPLPYDHPERIVSIDETSPDGTKNGAVSTANFLDWRSQSNSYAVIAGARRTSMTLLRSGEPMLLSGMRVSAGYFDVFGIAPALGRTFAPGEDQPGHDHVVVLSHRLWVSQFGSDPSVVDRPIRLDNEPYTVIGVMPAGGAFDRSAAQFWRPLSFAPDERARAVRWLQVMGRLKPDVTLTQARVEMAGIATRISHAYPDSNKNWGISADRLSDVTVTSQLERSLLVLLVAVGMLLLIGCVNLANLTLARGTSRELEVAVRASLGAGRARLLRQFLTENVVLAVAGGGLGIGFGYGAMRALKTVVPLSLLPRDAVVEMDGRVLLFALALSVVTGVVFGVVPALQATSPSLAGAMNEGGRGAAGDGRRRAFQNGLVVAEFAIAFLLLASGGLLLRSFFQTMNEHIAADESSVLTMWLPVPSRRFADEDALTTHQREIVSRVSALPGVSGVAAADALPLEGFSHGMPFVIASSKSVDRAHRSAAGFKIVQPKYFQVLGTRILRGRVLNDRDRKGTAPVAVVNETFVRRFFANADPIGQHLLIQQIVPGRPQLGAEIPWEVVGVTADEHSMSLDATTERPAVYVPFDQSPDSSMSLVIRTTVDPQALSRSVTQAIHSVDPDQVVSEVLTLDEIKRESTASSRLQTILLGVFAALALALAGVGVYGVISYSVMQRTREIGVRTALGASPRHVLALVLAGGLKLTLAGLAIGVAAALALTRLLGSLIFGVSPRDPLTLCGSALVLGTVAVLACYVPAHRASRLDPLVALRD